MHQRTGIADRARSALTKSCDVGRPPGAARRGLKTIAVAGRLDDVLSAFAKAVRAIFKAGKDKKASKAPDLNCLVLSSMWSNSLAYEVRPTRTMFYMASDSSLFQTEAQLREGGYIRQGADWVQERGTQPAQAVIALVGGRDSNHLDLSTGAIRAHGHFVPLYEAKMINFFDHRFGSYGQRGADRGYRVLPETTPAEYQDPSFETLPYYWVSAIEVERRVPPHWRSRWLLSFKDVTATTNERTAIFSAIPLVGVGHTLPIAMIQRPE